jgi:tetratricopeptide (TPR) repeat protein
LSLDCELVFLAAHASNNHVAAILTLETLLGRTREPSAKRTKRIDSLDTDSSSDSAIWRRIADLYLSAGFNEIRQAICEIHATSDVTKQAIEYEQAFEFEQALGVYTAAQSSDPDNAEINIWVKGELSCLEKLGRWEDLDRYCKADGVDLGILSLILNRFR